MSQVGVATVLDIAEAEAGYRESPYGSNKTKYGRWYGLDGNPWCAMFVSWVLHQAGFGTAYKHAYTPYGVDLFKKLGAWKDGCEDILPGDVVYFDFPDSVYRVQHVGFATSKPRGGLVRTIEGNTSSGEAGSQDNGGGVFERTRSCDHIVGRGRPAYREDFDWIVRFRNSRGEVRKRRYERLRLAIQKVRKRAKKGKTSTIRRVK